MKRWIHASKQFDDTSDEFDRQWEEKFGPDDRPKKFDTLEEFHAWLEEVKKFEPVYNE